MNHLLSILEPGTLTTVQDLGRAGQQSSGIAVGGAVDRISIRIANALVGNDASAACLECALIGPTIRCNRACVVALVGARSTALPQGCAVKLRAGQRVRLGPLVGRTYGYLAIAGGIDVPAVLASRATDLRIGIGGLDGRALRRGDSIPIGSAEQRVTSAAHVHADAFLRDGPIRILDGVDAHCVDPAWWQTSLRVSARSDRMGLRLEGTVPSRAPRAGDTSSSVTPGTIQLPPGGTPIVLLADAQTLGGYPQIAHVIAADLHRVAQHRPGDTVRFERVTLEVAHRLHWQQERSLAMMRYALRQEEGR